jgi:hypothetical protein
LPTHYPATQLELFDDKSRNVNFQLWFIMRNEHCAYHFLPDWEILVTLDQIKAPARTSKQNLSVKSRGWIDLEVLLTLDNI